MTVGAHVNIFCFFIRCIQSPSDLIYIFEMDSTTIDLNLFELSVYHEIFQNDEERMIYADRWIAGEPAPKK